MTQQPPYGAGHGAPPPPPPGQGGPAQPPPPFMPPPGGGGGYQSPSGGGGGQMPPPGPGPHKKSKLGLILGISIPAAVILIAAIIAAIVVPQMMRDNRIDDAVEAFEQQHSDWEAAYSEERLRELDTAFEGIDLLHAARGERTVSRSDDDYVPVTEQCIQLDGIAQLHAELDVEAPARPNAEGADGVERYEELVARYNANLTRYEAGSRLFERLAADQTELHESCDFIARAADAWDARTDAVAQVDVLAGAFRTGESFRIDASNGEWEITCTDETGCFDPRTPDSRRANSEAWARAYVQYPEDLLVLFQDACPNGMEDACEAEITYWTMRAGYEHAVSEALLADPRTQLEVHEQSDYDFQAAWGELREWNETDTTLDNVPNVFVDTALRFNDLRDGLLEARDQVIG